MVARVQQLAKGNQAAAASVAFGAGDGWAAPTAGNLLVVAANGDTTINTPTGSGTWTAGPGVLDGDDTHVWYKFALGTETTITIPNSAGNNNLCCTVAEYSGIAAFDAQNSSTFSGSTGTVTAAAAVTTTAAGDLVLAFAMLHSGAVTSVPTGNSWTAGLTQVLTAVSNVTWNTSSTTLIFVGELLAAGSAGSVSPTASWTNGAADRQQLTIAFKASTTTADAPFVPQYGPGVNSPSGQFRNAPAIDTPPSGDTTATPDTVAGTTAIGTVTFVSDVAATPATVAPPVTVIGAPVVTVTAQPATVLGTATIPAPAPRVTVLPATVAGSTAIAAPTVQIIPTPATVAGSTSIGAPTGLVTAQPATVAGSTAIAGTGTVTVVPATVAGTTAVGTPSAGGGNAPFTVTGSTTIGAPTGTVTAFPATVAGVTAVAAPVVRITPVPATVTGTTTVGAPVPSVTAQPATVAGTTAVGAPVPGVTAFPATVLGTATIPAAAPAVPDLIAPSIPANLHVVTLGSTTTDIAWDASTDNVAVTGYDIELFGP